MLFLLLGCATTSSKLDDTADTCTTSCGDSADTDPTGDRYHPDGWADSSVHGHAAKYQDESCTSCHGADLAGGTAGVSCDECHESGWRTQCTFCHGGSENTTGAPAEGIDDVDADSAFGAHASHVTVGVHDAYGCVQCHVQPADVLSAGHFLTGDGTPGVSEVSFSGGLSTSAAWSSSGCTNVYCHGNGNGTLGSVDIGDAVACGTCHAVEASWWTGGWLNLGGEHIKHLWEGYLCAECHSATVAEGDVIVDPALHVNGTLDVALPYGMTWSAGTCNGECHGEGHTNQTW